MTRVTAPAFALLALAAVSALPPSAFCQDSTQEKILDIRGFGGWAAAKTDNDNVYPDQPFPLAGKDLQLDNVYFTLNLLARPVERVKIHVQPTWQSSMRGRDLRLDLAYVEVSVVKD